MRLLITLFTHNAYGKFIPEIWERLKDLKIPEDFKIVDRIITTESSEDLITDYAIKNDLDCLIYPSERIEILNKYDKDRKNFSGHTLERMFKIINTRNFYLDYAKENGYDYLLQIDGDVLPPVDGLIKLYESGKKYVGAAIKKIVNGKQFYFVIPDRVKEGKLYECSILGNCFHLEHSDLFDYKYKLPLGDLSKKENHYKTNPDSFQRGLGYRKGGGRLWCDPTIKCGDLSNI